MTSLYKPNATPQIPSIAVTLIFASSFNGTPGAAAALGTPQLKPTKSVD